MSKADDALEYSKVAQNSAINAMMSVRAQGLIFEALLGILRDYEIIPQDGIARLFLGVAANLDSSEPSSDVEILTIKGMREFTEKIASEFNVNIPPPGQIEIQRKH